MMMDAEGERNRGVKDDSQASMMCLFPSMMVQLSKLGMVWGGAGLMRPDLDTFHLRCSSK